ncbi:Thiamin-phosphate pyrophosphorylase [Fulvivirga imtechensis AK7]|uniref:Thiamin-phosphate pyrophosphorylase n=1 Tax=Fulvivirga imtechensis AK7 TaxID=1237149 RepID=L8JH26_9BACT|nr:thiamine phosphate synthase [Fulvivirga imtechensis]ELR68166.1 Thiamin-phosphate pyrophosphorylase [Fulvivirga imtechensis AK7]
MSAVIAITQNNALLNEAELCIQLLELGLYKMHIRKPEWSTKQLIALISEIPEQYRKRLVIHRDPDAAIATGAGGLHLPYRELITGRLSLPSELSLSASVHSWEEAQTAMKLCSYCFVSPVYDSISKKGYVANEHLSHVPPALRQKQIYALGGIHAGNCLEAIAKGYAGVAVLGYIWDIPGEEISRASQLIRVMSSEKMSI